MNRARGPNRPTCGHSPPTWRRGAGNLKQTGLPSCVRLRSAGEVCSRRLRVCSRWMLMWSACGRYASATESCVSTCSGPWRMALGEALRLFRQALIYRIYRQNSRPCRLHRFIENLAVDSVYLHSAIWADHVPDPFANPPRHEKLLSRTGAVGPGTTTSSTRSTTPSGVHVLIPCEQRRVPMRVASPPGSRGRRRDPRWGDGGHPEMDARAH